MMAFIMSPAAFTMARDGCWNSLKRFRPRLATSSRTVSKVAPGVVSLMKQRQETTSSNALYVKTIARGNLPVRWANGKGEKVQQSVDDQSSSSSLLQRGKLRERV